MKPLELFAALACITAERNILEGATLLGGYQVLKPRVISVRPGLPPRVSVIVARWKSKPSTWLRFSRKLEDDADAWWVSGYAWWVSSYKTRREALSRGA